MDLTEDEQHQMLLSLLTQREPVQLQEQSPLTAARAHEAFDEQQYDAQTRQEIADSELSMQRQRDEEREAAQWLRRLLGMGL